MSALYTLLLSASIVEDTDVACIPAHKADCVGRCLTGGKQRGCMDPPPVPGQCSFPRKQAVDLCARWPRCSAVNCAASRLDCQARGYGHSTLLSFGDADLFMPRRAASALAAQNLSSVVCTARLLREPKASVYAGGVQALSCSSLECTLAPAPQRRLQQAEQRLRRLSLRKVLVEADPDAPLLLYAPVAAASASVVVAPDVSAPAHERTVYESDFAKHYFLADAHHIYRTYFAQKRDGFFIEVGGLNGAADGSNSLFFERHLGWRGLMVEASPLNFAGLFTRRPLAWRLEAALGASTQTLSFSGHGCCGKVIGGAGGDSYRVRAVPIGRVLKAMGVARVDFWSLDVEGAELSVLEGMDWAIHVSVFLIESVNEQIRSLLRAQGFDHAAYSGPSRLNEIWVNRNGVP
ncbi:hypothetical protein EMIHUDRAFT_196010 [Emiliania huxleyi CCMP1516]|uniref:Methyltransferase FkbM domain-containing protein n=2 Tax=Emiliania huxleyi TaxID=2903 RepID=A0A0D3J3B1_EMIH1|nr:hypothetical protein EMIHUDRAFT_196010 [Emiliania huxleyi CCMP1516]EOD17996.1 hypothetical protein EMIHUDRAFT_196010 [Emiliania huxleyi CCMP1516]|eukprot:XP_005770425.1 hypothetical protein EMIHUDRAFT_196010 [Emiliania huxleyi CCMP1516]